MSGYPEKTAEEWAEEKRMNEKFDEIHRQVHQQHADDRAKAERCDAYEKALFKILKVLRLPKYEDFEDLAHGLAEDRINQARQEALCVLDAFGAFDK